MPIMDQFYILGQLIEKK